ncbi:hypothetical protein [Streptosporangium sp. KLBMP 9127]|nr:hypothetical protein [Streptosporangium sp. KLBMP 9127]
MPNSEPVEVDHENTVRHADAEPGQPGEYASWDAFWSQIEADQKPRTEVIRGVTVTVPRDLPLRVTRKIERLQHSDKEEDIASLLADVFGGDVLDTWIEAGMGATELQTVLAWAIAQASGTDISFRQAYDRVLERGKAQPANRKK